MFYSGQTRGRLSQSALFDDKACDAIDTFAVFQICKNERPLDPHSQRIRFHHLKVRSYQRSQIYLVDDEKIGARNTRAALARYLFAFCDLDDVDSKVGQLGAEGCLDLVA